MPRLFVGIPASEACRKTLSQVTARLDGHLRSKVRWTRPETVHVTLQFLGETPDDRVEAVADALGSLRFPSFELRPGGYGCFPHCRKPRVAWVGVARGGEECTALAGLVHDAMDPFGFKRGNLFTPHLTLGRVRKPQGDDWEALLAESESEWPAFTVDRFVLWESDLRPDGAVHTPVREFPLTTSP